MLQARLFCKYGPTLAPLRCKSSKSRHTSVPKTISIHESRIRSVPGDYQLIEGEKGLFHKEIPFGNWRAASYVNYFDVVPYVPEGYDDKRTVKSEITGESYHIGTTDYAVTRIAECGGLDAYLLKTPEEEIDSQFGVELKRLILLILESEQLLEQPISTEECLRQSLKLEAMLGFKLSTTDRMISEVLYENDIDDDDTLLGNIFDEVDEED
ncbi:hypothetical protein ACHWQZ_G013191 [Mnemiopsis leidyi]